MTVEEIRGGGENFPAGMRVLAVDDDQVCLMLLDNMLRQCQYSVTTTNQATMALKMLRENKDRFDLVISDVHMPDMDGFKLLELVGLEMDLPVIMLSANSDPKLVRKGVDHGACDYLVKPVRLEELRNIWQHVLRRKKFDAKKQNKSSDQAKGNQTSGGGHGSPLTGNTNQDSKFNRKRKDEEDESEDNGNESEDPATQKKPRVVWSIELHRKFVGAVNQLGIEKAVPKRILDLMNVDGLTRENVASHLQKYRLYLKRISSVTTQQVNMGAAYGVRDSPFMHNGLRDFRASLSNVGLSPYTTSGMLGRLNSPANVNLHNLTPSALVQPNQAQNLSNSVGQNMSLFQGISPSLEPNLLQQNNGPSTNFNTVNNPRMFTTFADPGAAIGTSSNLLSGAVNNTMMLRGNSTHGMAPYNSDSFSAGVSGSSNMLDPEKCNENWQNTADPSKMQSNPLLSTESFQNQLPLNDSRDNNSSNGPFLQNNPIDLSSGMAVTFEDSGEMQYHEGLVGDAQNMNRRWGDQRQTYPNNSNNAFGSLNSHIAAKSGILNQNTEMFVNGRWGGSGSTLMQQNESGRLATESRVRSNEEFLFEQPKLQGEFVPQSYDAFDELVNVMIKPGEERLSQLETVKLRLAQIGKECISYPEFLEICSKDCSSYDQGLEFAKILEQSGSVIVVGDMVFLRLQEVHNQGTFSP